MPDGINNKCIYNYLNILNTLMFYDFSNINAVKYFYLLKYAKEKKRKFETNNMFYLQY